MMGVIMSSTNVVSICQPPKTFSINEVNALIPLFTRITTRHESVVSELLSKQRFFLMSGASERVVNSVDPKVSREMSIWGQKLAKLGARVFESGFVGFDGGGFYYSWRYGESEITHFHYYNQHPFDRMPIKVVG